MMDSSYKLGLSLDGVVLAAEFTRTSFGRVRRVAGCAESTTNDGDGDVVLRESRCLPPPLFQPLLPRNSLES